MATTAGDKDVVSRLKSQSVESWPIARSLFKCPSVKAALKSLLKSSKGATTLRIPIPSSLQTTFLGTYESDIGMGDSLQVRLWHVRKVQRSHLLTAAEVSQITV